jgi:hypothetical protein
MTVGYASRSQYADWVTLIDHRRHLLIRLGHSTSHLWTLKLQIDTIGIFVIHKISQQHPKFSRPPPSNTEPLQLAFFKLCVISITLTVISFVVLGGSFPPPMISR